MGAGQHGLVHLSGENSRSADLMPMPIFLHLADQSRLRLPTVRVFFMDGPPQDHLSKGNMFLTSSFSSTFNALLFENIVLIIIDPVYDRGTMQNFAAMRASILIPFMEIVLYTTTTLPQRIMSP
jgi:hypothetical protein